LHAGRSFPTTVTSFSNGPPLHLHCLTTILHCCAGLHMLVKQLVFLKLKNMLCSRMLNSCRWSSPPAAATSAATATANPRRDRCGVRVALGCRRWSQPCASSAVATMLPHPTTTPARPQPIIRIIGHELTRFQPLCSRNRRLWHS
jgi:hypothetical protein